VVGNSALAVFGIEVVPVGIVGFNHRKFEFPTGFLEFLFAQDGGADIRKLFKVDQVCDVMAFGVAGDDFPAVFITSGGKGCW
jgi:hypothetical protein